MNPYSYHVRQIYDTKEDFLDDIKPINLRNEYRWMIEHNNNFIKSCKVYITDNYKDVADWNGLSLFVGHQWYGKYLRIGRDVIHREAITWIQFNLDYTDGALEAIINRDGNMFFLDDSQIVDVTFYIMDELIKQRQ